MRYCYAYLPTFYLKLSLLNGCMLTAVFKSLYKYSRIDKKKY